MAAVDDFCFDVAFTSTYSNESFDPQTIAPVETSWLHSSSTPFGYLPDLATPPIITNSTDGSDEMHYPLRPLHAPVAALERQQPVTEPQGAAKSTRRQQPERGCKAVEEAPEKKRSRRGGNPTKEVETPEPKPPVKTRSTSASTSTSMSSGDRVKARNRVAAAKFREKKRAYTDTLEEERSNLATLYHELHDEHAKLKNEVYRLKLLLMSHADCHNDNIDLWMKAEVCKFAEKGFQGQGLGH